MISQRHMERCPVQLYDRFERERCIHPAAPHPDVIASAAWAAEALAAAWPDCEPFADRVALLELCNPRALDDHATASNHPVSRLSDAIKAFFLIQLSRFRGIPVACNREPSIEQTVTGGDSDR